MGLVWLSLYKKKIARSSEKLPCAAARCFLFIVRHIFILLSSFAEREKAARKAAIFAVFSEREGRKGNSREAARKSLCSAACRIPAGPVLHTRFKFGAGPASHVRRRGNAGRTQSFLWTCVREGAAHAPANTHGSAYQITKLYSRTRC